MSTTPHDALFKAVFGQPEHARGILRSIVPAAVGEAIDWRALTLCPGSFVDAALAHQHTDLLYSTRWRGGKEALLYFLFEHLCGAPHKCSYAEPPTMRSRPLPRVEADAFRSA